MKASGHTEDEILEELGNIEKGESWVGFDNLPKKFNHVASSSVKK